jgi:hypothetical protein
MQITGTHGNADLNEIAEQDTEAYQRDGMLCPRGAAVVVGSIRASPSCFRCIAIGVSACSRADPERLALMLPGSDTPVAPTHWSALRPPTCGSSRMFMSSGSSVYDVFCAITLRRRWEPHDEISRKAGCGNPHVRLDERGRETGMRHMAQVTAPFLDSTMESSRRFKPPWSGMWAGQLCGAMVISRTHQGRRDANAHP